MGNRHVVFGASGGVGNAIVRVLHEQGKSVLGVNRSGKAIVPEGVELAAADASNIDDVRRVVAEVGTIYNATFPSVQDSIIEVAAENKATVVLVNTLYMYDPKQGPMSEDSPHFYGNREGGRFYAEIADQLLAAHKDGKIKGVVSRATDVYGPNVEHGIGSDLVFGPAMNGKAVSFLGKLDVPHAYIFSDDYARTLITLGEQEKAHGEIWHAPSPEPITPRQLLQMIFDELGVQPKIRVADGMLLTMLAIFSSQMRRIKKEKHYQFVDPWLVDSSKFEQAFGSTVTPHTEAVKQTVAWFQENKPA